MWYLFRAPQQLLNTKIRYGFAFMVLSMCDRKEKKKTQRNFHLRYYSMGLIMAESAKYTPANSKCEAPDFIIFKSFLSFFVYLVHRSFSARSRKTFRTTGFSAQTFNFILAGKISRRSLSFKLCTSFFIHFPNS